MKAFLIIVGSCTLFSVAQCRPQTAGTDAVSFDTAFDANEEDARKAAENAKYSFSTDVKDDINDLTFHRDETRNGLKTTGSYSYSDGFHKRTVFYTADESGYHITKQTLVKLNGPVINLNGFASVRTVLPGGHEIHYRIQGVPDKDDDCNKCTKNK